MLHAPFKRSNPGRFDEKFVETAGGSEADFGGDAFDRFVRLLKQTLGFHQAEADNVLLWGDSHRFDKLFAQIALR